MSVDADPSEPAAPPPPDPQNIAALQERLDIMFVRHFRNPVMKLVYDTAIKFANEGKIRG